MFFKSKGNVTRVVEEETIMSSIKENIISIIKESVNKGTVQISCGI